MFAERPRRLRTTAGGAVAWALPALLFGLMACPPASAQDRYNRAPRPRPVPPAQGATRDPDAVGTRLDARPAPDERGARSLGRAPAATPTRTWTLEASLGYEYVRAEGMGFSRGFSSSQPFDEREGHLDANGVRAQLAGTFRLGTTGLTRVVLGPAYVGTWASEAWHSGGIPSDQSVITGYQTNCIWFLGWQCWQSPIRETRHFPGVEQSGVLAATYHAGALAAEFELRGEATYATGALRVGGWLGTGKAEANLRLVRRERTTATPTTYTDTEQRFSTRSSRTRNAFQVEIELSLGLRNLPRNYRAWEWVRLHVHVGYRGMAGIPLYAPGQRVGRVDLSGWVVGAGLAHPF